ncbi:MAG: coenzyme F420-0:L-glutamate ligase [Chloroflexi bacterium]|nr:coenzyme F420-0:L-glutamate ligase [Chloroflexota bacterium]
MSHSLNLIAVPGMLDVQPGDDLAQLIVSALQTAVLPLKNGDVLAIAQKVISKAEGRFMRLSDVTPSAHAVDVASKTEKDPRMVELILQESDEISRMRPGVLVVRHRLGFTSANAGIDRSNVSQDADENGMVLLLPVDPDKSAEAIRVALQGAYGVRVGVVITDSHGRPFRLGTLGVAIGVAGIPALWDRRGEKDLYGYTLQHTDIGIADEIAAAAGLLMGQAAEGMPVVLVRGLNLPPMDGKASDLVRPKEKDLYR